MSEKPINPGLKSALEFGPLAIFFVVYFLYKDEQFTLFGQTYDGFLFATLLFIPLILISTGLFWFITGTLSRMQVGVAVLVVVFGGLGLWFNDERFFKIKPTVIYVIMGGLLAIGLMRGKSYLEYVLAEALTIDSEGWMKLTKRFCLLFFGLAALNEVVWRSFSTEMWVNYRTFGPTLIMFAFMLTQAGVLKQHWIEDEQSESDKG